MGAPPATAGKGCRHPMYMNQPQEKVQGCQEIPMKDECWYQPEKQELVRNSKGLRGEEQRGKVPEKSPSFSVKSTHTGTIRKREEILRGLAGAI